MIFFTSDTHFGDHRVLNIGKRPFASTAEMDAVLAERWNGAVGPEDEVWHLGDVARKPAEVSELLARLNGTKHLLRGNNDPPGTLEAAGWASIHDYRELELDGRFLVLCHYPFESWNRKGAGAVHLHGHSHGRLKPMTRRYDVGVDVHGFRPVQLDEILSSR